MLLANIEHDGASKVALFTSEETAIDFGAALQIRDLLDGSSGDGPVRCIQDLLDSGQWSLRLFESVSDLVLRKGLNQLMLNPGEVRYRAPFSRPGQIIALARNYSDHAEESVLPRPHEPIFFSKSNTSVIGHGDEIVLPLDLGGIEPEIELAFIIRKQAWHVPSERAAEYVAGYTILNDVSAQDLQRREIQENYPLFRCKSLRTFTPMGPGIVTVDEVGIDPSLDMCLRVNGDEKVASNTGNLTFGIPRLVEFISRYIVLAPGDIVTTGCPKAAEPLHPGDMVELEIEKIGVLQNPVTAEREVRS